jgi:hypothetical protein
VLDYVSRQAGPYFVREDSRMMDGSSCPVTGHACGKSLGRAGDIGFGDSERAYPFFFALIFAQRALWAAAIRLRPATDMLRLVRVPLLPCK